MIKQDIKVACDSVVFSYINGELQLLLIERKNEPFKGKWCLPGGFMEDSETPEAGAIRELQEETGVQLKTILQLGAFGAVDRDPRFRVISIAHYALIDAAGHEVKANDDAAAAQWHKVSDLPDLAFDHNLIVAQAMKHMGELLH